MTGGDAGGPRQRRLIDHVDALDGLRALAVTAVVLFHLDRLPGGNLGVDAFFVLSGWLITTRLLRSSERSRDARLDVWGFWAGRVRRLLPASLAVLATVSIIWTVMGIDVPSLPRDLLWTLGWSSNWGTITSGGDYWARFGEPSPVAHFWSLAVEEQFYLAWPLLLFPLVRCGAGRRDALVGLTSGVLAVASIAFMALTFSAENPTATYIHTLARAHTLLIGAAAAALTASAARRSIAAAAARRCVPVAAGTAVLLVAVSSDRSIWLYTWGFPLFALAIAVIVVAASDGGLAGPLGSRPLRWVGDRSYGIYLWHWPVILYLRADRAPFEGLGLDVLRVALTVALAAASYRWLEMPIRQRTRAIRTAPALVAAAVVALGALVLVRLPNPTPRAVSSEVRLAPAKSTGVPSAPLRISSLSSLPTSPTIFVPAPEPVPVPIAQGPVRVLVVGDSTAVRLAEALLPYADDHPEALQVGTAAHAGCGLTAGTDGRLHGMVREDGSIDLIDLGGCTQAWDRVRERVASTEGFDIVLVFISAWDGVDIHLPDGKVMSTLDREGRDLVRSAYQAFVADIETTGTRVVWVTPPDVHQGWGGIDSTLNDRRRWTALRSIIDLLPVEQVDLREWLNTNGLDTPAGRPDGVHLAPDVNRAFVADVVAPTLISLGPTGV